MTPTPPESVPARARDQLDPSVDPTVDSLQAAAFWIGVLHRRSVADADELHRLRSRIAKLERGSPQNLLRRFYRRLREVGATW